jgi:hypothetical protein
MSEIPRIPPRSAPEYESVFEPLLDSDEAAARAWIQQSSLSEESKRRLLDRPQ